MKIEVEGKTFEFTVDGKPLEEDDVFAAFVVLASTFFPYAVVARENPADDAAVRAVTFAVDEDYLDALVEFMEEKLPSLNVGAMALGEA